MGLFIIVVGTILALWRLAAWNPMFDGPGIDETQSVPPPERPSIIVRILAGLALLWIGDALVVMVRADARAGNVTWVHWAFSAVFVTLIVIGLLRK